MKIFNKEIFPNYGITHGPKKISPFLNTDSFVVKHKTKMACTVRIFKRISSFGMLLHTCICRAVCHNRKASSGNWKVVFKEAEGFLQRVIGLYAHAPKRSWEFQLQVFLNLI